MMMRGCVCVCRGVGCMDVEGLHLYSIYFLPLKVLQSFFFTPFVGRALWPGSICALNNQTLMLFL